MPDDDPSEDREYARGQARIDVAELEVVILLGEHISGYNENERGEQEGDEAEHDPYDSGGHALILRLMGAWASAGGCLVLRRKMMCLACCRRRRWLVQIVVRGVLR